MCVSVVVRDLRVAVEQARRNRPAPNVAVAMDVRVAIAMDVRVAVAMGASVCSRDGRECRSGDGRAFL